MLSLIKFIVFPDILEPEKKRLDMYQILNNYDLSQHLHIQQAIYSYINLNDEKILYSKEAIFLEFYINKMIHQMINKKSNNYKEKYD